MVEDKDYGLEDLVEASARQLEKDLVDWKNPPTVTDLKKDQEGASRFHSNQMIQVNSWLDNLHITGSAKLKKKQGRSNIQPKVIRKQAEWRYAAMSEPFLSVEDLFTAQPVTHEDKLAAQQNELILNAQFRSYVPKTKFIDDYVRAGVNEGTIICRTGWVYEEETYLTTEPVYEFEVNNSEEAITMMDDMATLFQQDPQKFNQLPEEIKEALELSINDPDNVYVPVVTEYREVEKVRVLKNHPTVEVVNIHNVIVDPTCKGDLDKANFIIYRFISNQSLLAKAGIYKNLDKIKHIEKPSPLEQSDTEIDERDIESFTFDDEPRKRFVVDEYWGYWDINGDGKLVPIIATYVGDTMIRLEENPFPDKKPPFVIVPYLPVKESVYGEPDGVLIEDNQRTIGAVTRGMIDLMGRSANSQIGISKEALDATNKRRFNRGDDYEFNPTVDPRTAFYMHQYPEIPNSAKEMVILQNQEVESLTGTKAFSNTGLTGDALGKTSARGVQGVLSATAQRELGILRRLADGIIQIGRKFIAMNAEWLSEEEVVRTTNAEFVPVRRDDLSGKIDLKLNISSAEDDNQKAQELAFMLQTVGPNSDPGAVKMIQAEIARLRKMPTLAKRIEEYEPQPDPLQQEKVMLEIELLKAQIENERADSFKKQSEGVAEQADARKKDSEADLNNLDFVEQESGTKHARERDKIVAQADSQTAKSIIESQIGQ